MPGKKVVKNSQKGSRQAYANRQKFDPYRYKHASARLGDDILLSATSLCCKRCCEIIQWKVDYGKYRQLESAKKCNSCDEKAVILPFHHFCQHCAETKKCCAKCQRQPTLLEADSLGGELIESGTSSNEDSGESDSDERENTTQPVHPLGRYHYVDEEDSDEEFTPLRGLNVRMLKARKQQRQEVEEQKRKGKEKNSLRTNRQERTPKQVPMATTDSCNASSKDEEL